MRSIRFEVEDTDGERYDKVHSEMFNGNGGKIGHKDIYIVGLWALEQEHKELPNDQHA